MPSKPKTDKRRGTRTPSTARESLVAAARELFTQQGYEATSVVEITQRAGISVGSLYYHFGGKAEIFLAMHDDYRREQDRRVREALQVIKGAGITDPRRQFLAGARAYLTGIWEARDVSRILADGQTPSGFATVSKQWFSDWITRNTMMLADGDSPLVTQALASAVAGSVGAWAKDIVEFPNRNAAEQFIDEAVIIIGRMLGITAQESRAITAPRATSTTKPAKTTKT